MTLCVPPGAYQIFEKKAGMTETENPFIDPKAWDPYLAAIERNFLLMVEKRSYVIVVVFARKTGVFTSQIVSTYKKMENPENVLAMTDTCCYNVDIVRVKPGVDMTFLSLFRIYGTRGIADRRCLLFGFVQPTGKAVSLADRFLTKQIPIYRSVVRLSYNACHREAANAAVAISRLFPSCFLP